MARDIIHESVKQALINDGWTITADPFRIEFIDDENKRLEADMAAQKFLIAEKRDKKIVVEVKTFSGASILNNFHAALGQYIAYRDALEEAAIYRELFLAVSDETFENIQEVNFLKREIEKYQLKFIIVDVEDKTLVKWIN